jgi:hypothetical protein
MPFSTMDRDNDNNPNNCAEIFSSGWWHDACFKVNLNGLSNEQSYNGISWRDSKEEPIPIKLVRMMIRPT